MFSKENPSFDIGGGGGEGGIAQDLVQGVFNIQPSGATDKASQCPLIPPLHRTRLYFTFLCPKPDEVIIL